MDAVAALGGRQCRPPVRGVPPRERVGKRRQTIAAPQRKAEERRMNQTILGFAFLLAATPAGAQQPAAAQPAAVSQAIPPPEEMDDSIPPAAEFVAIALEKSPRHA